MPTLVQLTPDLWINLDKVTIMTRVEGLWKLKLSWEAAPLTLDAEASAALEAYLRRAQLPAP